MIVLFTVGVPPVTTLLIPPGADCVICGVGAVASAFRGGGFGSAESARGLVGIAGDGKDCDGDLARFLSASSCSCNELIRSVLRDSASLKSQYSPPPIAPARRIRLAENVKGACLITGHSFLNCSTIPIS